MTASRTTPARVVPVLALGCGFYGMCVLSAAYQGLILRNFDPLAGSAVNVLIIIMVHMFGPAVLMMLGTLASTAFVPRIIAQHAWRLHLISVLVGAAGFWLLIGLLALRRWLQDSLLKPTDLENYIITLVMAFLIGASIWWLAVRLTIACGGLLKVGAPGERCDQCGYDLRGSASQTCPECGATR